MKRKVWCASRTMIKDAMPNYRKKEFWIGERRRRAERMWADGASFSEIGAAVGATRNAVASHIRRSGLNRSKQEPPVVAQVRIEFPPKSFPLALPAPPRLLALPAPVWAHEYARCYNRPYFHHVHRTWRHAIADCATWRLDMDTLVEGPLPPDALYCPRCRNKEMNVRAWERIGQSRNLDRLKAQEDRRRRESHDWLIVTDEIPRGLAAA